MIDLIGKKYYFFALSILIILAGVIAYFVHGGFNLDIQFSGGTRIQIPMTDNNYDTNKAQSILSKEIKKNISVQKSTPYANSNATQKMNLLVVSVAGKDVLTDREQTIVIDTITKNFSVDKSTKPLINSVAPSIGAEILKNGLLAVLFSSLLIILYIWIRFKIMSGLSAGVMAIIALLHDGLIMLSVYTIFQIPLNEAFIAAVLTVIGYSMNDTIIIYDRVRENSKMLRKYDVAEMVNKSILQTLNRSINTVVTVLISITTVFIFAKVYNIVSVADFSFPLIVGIASGCYSSIFIASPLWVIWKEYQERKRISKRIKPARA